MFQLYVEPTARRADERQTLDLPVDILIYREAARDGHVRNISKGGALIDVPADMLERGDEVIVDFRCDLVCVATIAWMKPGMIGAAFHRKLTDGEMDAIHAQQAIHDAQRLDRQATRAGFES